MKKGITSFKTEIRHVGNGRIFVIGCDEVGRGCLAGPVVAGAVLFDWSKKPEIEALAKRVFITDSKAMTHADRLIASKEIRKLAIGVGIGVVSVSRIDEINILQASLLAMRHAVTKARKDFKNKKSFQILVDGNKSIPGILDQQETVIGGDGKVFSIAAASIVAKVYRDKLMEKLHGDFPEYAWEKNKGYGTKAHREAILKHGLTEHHRVSFCHF